MHNINELFPEGIHSVGIAGHVNPDGDCVGSCSALYLYIRKNFPEISVDLYLEKPKAVLMQIPGASDAKNEAEEDKQYDLFIICDVSSMERIGVAGDLFQKASHTACIDHHVSNTGLAEVNEIAPKASSCAEVLCGLLTDELIDVDIAQALYTGMIHDSGVFQYRNTSPATLRCAAALLEKGFDATAIIEQTFNQRTFVQNRITGFALETAELFCGDRCILSAVTASDRARYDADLRDLDIIVSQLRLTAGTVGAVFIYETENGDFKVSLRSNDPKLDVAAVAAAFGGGGHAAAAGYTTKPPLAAARMQAVEAMQSALGRMDRSL